MTRVLLFIRGHMECCVTIGQLFPILLSLNYLNLVLSSLKHFVKVEVPLNRNFMDF